MSVEDRFHKIYHGLRFLRVSWGMMFPIQQVSGGEGLVVDDGASWLEGSVISNLVWPSGLPEGQLKRRRVFGLKSTSRPR